MSFCAEDRSIPTLDGWRALAVLWVILFHANAMLFLPGGLLPNRILQRFSGQGELGVEIFFGLSGFLITTRLLAERPRGRGARLLSFYSRRAFRILPAAWLYVAAVAALAAANWIPPLSPNEIASSLFFWRNYAPSGQATGHFWSLAVEEHFYFLWPAAFLLIPGKRSLLRAALAAALTIAVWRVLDLRFHIAHSLFSAVPDWIFRTDLRVDAILWGCIAALALPKLKTIFEWSGARAAQCITAMVFCLCAWLRYQRIPFAETALAIAIPAMILSTVLFPATVLGRLLDLAALRLVGRLSYSLYLWQQLFTMVLPPQRSDTGGDGPFVLLMIAGWIVCSCASYFLVEQPLIHFGRRLRAIATHRHEMQNHEIPPEQLLAGRRL